MDRIPGLALVAVATASHNQAILDMFDNKFVIDLPLFGSFDTSLQAI